jgi:hypothetical protein
MCTMKCPRCGQTATKEKPRDQFKCESCGWRLTQSSARCGFIPVATVWLLSW